MTEHNFASGQCLCGKVHYTISSGPRVMSQCHCDDCRRATGTGHASNAFFKKSDVQISGETSCYATIADSGSTITRYFCPACGSPLFGTLSRLENVLAVAVGSLDDSSWFKPSAQGRHATSRNSGTPVAIIRSPTQRMGDALNALRPQRLRTKAASSLLPHWLDGYSECNSCSSRVLLAHVESANCPVAYQGLKITTSLSSVSMIFSDCL